MAVEAEPGFEAQRVAGAKPDWRHLRFGEKPLSQSDGIFRGDGQLEAVLSSIAGADHKTWDPGDRKVGRAHEWHSLDIAGKTRQHRRSRGALQGQQCAVKPG